MSKHSPIAKFFDRSFSDDSYPRVKYCPDQTSLCLFGPIDSGGMIHWRPVRRALSNSHVVFDQFPPSPIIDDAKAFVSGFWCAPLECSFGYEPFMLHCGAWNESDYREKQLQLQIEFADQEDRDLPFSVPLGVSVSGSECRYSLHLDTGEIWLEEPDGRPFEKQADSMAAFFAILRYHAVTEDLLDKVFE